MSFTTKAIENIKHRPVKVQIFSKKFLIGNFSGNDVYVLDLLRFLKKVGFEIEVILLNSSSSGKGLVIIPFEFEDITFLARDNLRVGRVLVRARSCLEWISSLPWLVYDLLPNNFRSIYRSAKKRLQQMYGHRTTSKKFQLQDLAPLPEEIAFAKAQFARFQPDVVIANYVYLGSLLDALPSHEAILKVILTHDIQYQRFSSFQQVGVDSDCLNWDCEKESVELRKAQVLLAIQEEDARVLKEMAPQCQVICTPMPALCHSHTVRQVPGRCLFVGSAAPHNVHSLKWFLDHVWPIVLQSVPHSSLHICGKVCHRIQGMFPNVRLLGEIDDLKPEYGAAEVCLVPLLVGSGLKIKLVEALSHGRACVATGVGVQGLCDIAGSAVLVADTAEDFAAAVGLLLTNPRKRQWMEEQALQYVIERLSPQTVYQPFVERIYQHLDQTASTLNRGLPLSLVPKKETPNEI
jgi:hypothetical protein